MVTQPYSTAYFPPVPVLNVEISASEMDEWHGPFTAMVDSGADFTNVPMSLIELLQTRADREAVLRSQWQDRHYVEIHEVDIRIGTGILPSVEVAGDQTSSDILIGRNILNYLDIQLNGPQLELRLLNI